jgi:MFS family permease
MIGRFVSLIGSGIQMLALPLYILDRTGSGTLMGLFSILSLVPALLSAPMAGIIGDRKNRRNVMVYVDLGRGAFICILGLIAMTGNINIILLFMAQVLISIMDSLFNSSSGALMPELIEGEKLMGATSVRGSMDGIAFIIGPCLGGLVYGLLGIKAVFLINGVSFLLCAVTSILIKYNKVIVEKAKISRQVVIKETGEALSFIGKHKGLLQLFTFAMVSNFLMAPMIDIVFPFALKKGIGFTSTFYGYIFGCFTLGVVAGNLAIGFYFKKWSSKKLMKTGLVMEAIVMLAVSGLMFPAPVALLGGPKILLFIVLAVLVFLIGFNNAFVNTPISTNLQKMVPDTMRARFFSLLGIFSQGAIPIGSITYGVLLDKTPYYYLITVISILSAFVTFYFLFRASEEAYEPKIAA